MTKNLAATPASRTIPDARDPGSCPLLLHGFLGSPARWEGVGPRGSVCPWLPGHGLSPWPCPAGLDEGLAALAAALPPGPLTLVGYSMGARIALALLVRHPERFRRAVLIGLHPGLRAEAERAARRAWEDGARALLAREGLGALVDRWEQLPVLRPAGRLPDHVLARRRAVRLGHTAGGIAQCLETFGLGAMPSLWGEIPAVRVPVRLLAGAADERYCARAREACRLNQGWSFQAVPGASHDVGLEAPAAVLSAIGGSS